MEKSKRPEKLQKQTKLDKFRETEQILILHGSRPLDSRRPFTAAGIDSVKEAEGWRKEIIQEIIEKVENISDPNLDEFRARELNDSINRSMREMRHWEYRIKELGMFYSVSPIYLLILNCNSFIANSFIPSQDITNTRWSRLLEKRCKYGRIRWCMCTRYKRLQILW